MLVHSSDIENLWKLKALGITDSKENRSDVELQEAVWDHFHKTLNRTEDRYEVSLSWINEKDKLPSNREVAKKRLISTTKKLFLKDKTEAYNAVFEVWFNCGIIEEVPEEEKSVHSMGRYSKRTRPIFHTGRYSKRTLQNP
ncbi:hypothetical protein HNY73_006187 [Argiope bruennichi]|uniref:Uncharacterized protein n=1 Tax=Argiope bruennichi TaxID=94029 RepID=A0A8T0FNV4_ARGBR|nr:hypothetical protein HNY73_006187 [Argiope bruennichi]